MKKYAIVLLALCTAAAFAACGSGKAAPAPEASSQAAASSGVSSASDESGSASAVSSDIPVDALIYEGKVVSITFDDAKDGALKGSVEMTDFEGQNAYIFHFDAANTQLDPDIKAVAAGDALHVVHSPAATRSIPPQSSAFMIERMEAPNADTAGSAEPMEPVSIEGAEVFRGTLEDFAVGDNGVTVWVMRPAAGTGYEDNFMAAVSDQTQYGFDASGVGNGAFLEIFYDKLPGKDGSYAALGINQIRMGEEAVYYNGELVSVTRDGDNGQLVMKPFPQAGASSASSSDPLALAGEQFVFNFGPETVFTAPLESLKAGDSLNIYHSPIMTMSLPPQSPALEVRAFVPKEEEKALGTVKQ